MLCEMCGADRDKLLLIEVEGSLLKVCQNCSRFGKQKAEPKRAQEGKGPSSPQVFTPGLSKRRSAYSVDVFDKMGDKEVVDDYSKIIRRVRESLGLSQKELGLKINEKQSVIAQLESGTIMPDDKMIKKLERAFSIKLTDKYQPVSQVKQQKEAKPRTLQDIINEE
jgi:putative transcription factor